MQYGNLTIDQLTSTKYWRKIPEISNTNEDIFRKSFKTLNDIPISSKDKSDLLKIKHNIVGTPYIRVKYTDIPADCAFCTIDKRDPHLCCKKSALPEMLSTCKTTISFIQQIASLPSLANINFKTDPTSRLIHQIGHNNEADLNFTHAMLNLYLRKSAFFRKIPNTKDFHTFLLPRITLALRRQCWSINDSFLKDLLIETEPPAPCLLYTSPSPRDS